MSKILLNGIFQNILGKLSALYIDFVYKTSKIIKIGDHDIMNVNNPEKFVTTFWHGENYCFYPLLKNNKLFVITTKDTRGNYISDICKYFGYTVIRAPDNIEDGTLFFKMKKQILNNNDNHLAMTLDGPLGPYHVIKIFPLLMALSLKRKILPISIDVKYKIRLKNRWDKYIIPLPFNEIKIYAHLPIEINRKDLKENFVSKIEEITKVIENKFD